MTDSPVETSRKQGGGRFKPGHSGNPAGRPRGSRNKTTLAAEALLDGEAEALTRLAIEKAKEGDLFALKLCLERVVAPRRERPAPFDMPPLKRPADARQGFSAIVEAIASGQLAPGEAATVAGIVASYARLGDPNEPSQEIRDRQTEALRKLIGECKAD